MGCKVDTLVERYDLRVPAQGYDSVDQYLVGRWTGADGRSADGYKSLTTWFNKQLLKRIYEDHDRDTMGLYLDQEYELITGEDDLRQDELAADLATYGLDIEDVQRELISWSTMRHHLKDCLDAEKETQSATTEWESDTVEMARERTEEKTRSVLTSLDTKGKIAEAERVDVDVEVKLGCPECSVRVPFESAIERGYVCETHSETESDDTLRERAQNGLSGIAVSYGFVEALQAMAVEEGLVFETLAGAPL